MEASRHRSRQGRSELNQAIRNFTSGKEYVEFLKKFPAEVVFEDVHGLQLNRNDESRRSNASLWDDDLLPYFRGEKNPAFAEITDGRRRTVANRYISGAYLLNKPERLRQELLADLGHPQFGIAVGPDEIFEKIDDSYARILGYSPEELPRAGYPGLGQVFDDVFLKVVAGHPQESRILREVYLERKVRRFPYSQYAQQWGAEPAGFRKVSARLKSSGAVPALFSVFDPSNSRPSGYGDSLRAFATSLHPALPALKEELDVLAVAKLDDFYRTVFEPLSRVDRGQARNRLNGYRTDSDLLVGKAWDELKAGFLKRLKDAEFPFDRKLEMFQEVSGLGPTRETDQFFREQIVPQLDHLPPSQKERTVLSLVQGDHLWDKSLEFDLAKPFLERKAASTLGKSADRKALERFLQFTERTVPAGTREKDAFLESLVWNHGIDDLSLVELVEKSKSTDLTRGDPHSVNRLSAASDLVQRLEPSEARQLFEFYIPHLQNG